MHLEEPTQADEPLFDFLVSEGEEYGRSLLERGKFHSAGRITSGKNRPHSNEIPGARIVGLTSEQAKAAEVQYKRLTQDISIGLPSPGRVLQHIETIRANLFPSVFNLY